MKNMEIFPAGDCALVVEFGNRIEEEINDKVHALSVYLKKREVKGIRETLLFVLTPHSFRQRKTAHKEARKSCFWMKGRIVAEVPAGVQYRVARLPVNWRGRLARK